MSISDLDPAVPGSDGPAGQGDDELRAIKAALVEAFPAVDGPITNTGGTIDPPDAVTWSALFTRLTAVEDGAGNGIVGEIKAYYADIANIPTGWYLCNGTNGTPDLTGRFLIGGDSGSGLPTYTGTSQGGVLGTGGETGPSGSHVHTMTNVTDHTLTTANLPAHEHKLFGPLQSGDPSTVGANDAASSQWEDGSGKDQLYDMKPVPTDPTTLQPTLGRSSLTGSGTGVSHAGSVDSVAAHTHTLGEGSLPPWNAVYYIMFTGA